MGFDYNRVPLESMVDADGRVKFLDSIGMPFSIIDKGRWPTLREVRETLATTPNVHLDDISVGADFWDIFIKGIGDEWTSLLCIQYSGDENEPQLIYFEKGWPEFVVRVTEALSHICGDFVIVGPGTPD